MTPLEAAQAIIDARARATQGHFVADANVYGTGKYVCCEHGAIPKGDRIAEILESLAGLDSNQSMANAIFFAFTANHAADVAQAYIDSEKRVAELVELVEETFDEAYWCCEVDSAGLMSSLQDHYWNKSESRKKLARIMGKETQDDAAENC